MTLRPMAIVARDLPGVLDRARAAHICSRRRRRVARAGVREGGQAQPIAKLEERFPGVVAVRAPRRCVVLHVLDDLHTRNARN